MKKMTDEMRRQLSDPQEREKLKRQEIVGLQAMNIGAAARLHLNEQTFDRILELQAEQNLAERAASIGTVPRPRSASLNPQIAEEFGDAVANRWLENQRQLSGRMAVRSVANLFADANLPLSDDQRQRLVGVYAEAFEAQAAQDSPPEIQTQDNLRKPGAMEAWYGKMVDRQNLFNERVQTDAAAFLTPAQLELLWKKADVEFEQLRSIIESMPKTVDGPSEVHQVLIEC